MINLLRLGVSVTLAFAAAAPARAAAPLAREVIVLCRPTDAFTINSAPPFPALALVLNHLGLVPRFHDIATGLPGEAESARTRGVLVWLDSGDAPDPEALDRWLLARIRAGKRIALLSGVAALVEKVDGGSLPRSHWGPILEALDMRYEGLADEVPERLTFEPTVLPHAEAPLPVKPRAFWKASALPG